MLFSEVDSTSIIKRDTGLRLAGVIAQRGATFNVAPGATLPLPPGPAASFFYRYGRTPAPQRILQPPGPRATYVDVHEYLEAESRGIHLLRETGPGSPGSVKDQMPIWFFSADLDHHHVTLDVESDGPKSVVSRIGWDLVKALRAARVPPSLPVEIYVLPPHGVLHVGHPATFYVANNDGAVTANVVPDYAFHLGGAWSRPRTFAQGDTRTCGGDTAPGQPYRKNGLWKFAWGDCRELGLLLTPTRAGPHSLTIYCYRVPRNAQGLYQYRQEQLEPRQTYTWHGTVGA